MGDVSGSGHSGVGLALWFDRCQHGQWMSILRVKSLYSISQIKYTIVHFGCHGSSTDDPSKSCFFLEDVPLIVSDIALLNIESAKLAYLSACHASSMRSFG